MDAEVLPDAPLWAFPLADTRSPVSSVTLRGELGDPLAPAFGQRVDAALGADFPLVQLHFDEVELGFGISAATWLGFTSDGELTFGLRTFDGLFAFPIDAEWRQWTGRFQWAHVSAHYGDGIRKEPRDQLNPDPFSREYVQLQGGRELWGHGRIYAGTRAVIHGTPTVPPLGFQVGAEGWGPWRVAPYVAVDLKINAEDAWSPAVCGQLGARVRSGRYRFRTALVLYDGPDDTGKWHALEERWIGLQFGFDGTGRISRPGVQAGGQRSLGAPGVP